MCETQIIKDIFYFIKIDSIYLNVTFINRLSTHLLILLIDIKGIFIKPTLISAGNGK